MKCIVLVTVVACALFVLASDCHAQTEQGKRPHVKRLSHVEWVAKCLGEIQSIQQGMRRADVEKIMKTEGKLFSPGWGHYVHKECRYFKVDFEFTYGRSKDGTALWSPDDKIVKASRPYLDALVIH